MASKNEVGPKGQMIMGIVFIIGSLVVTGLSLNDIFSNAREAAAAKWPQVSGKVIDSGARQLRNDSTPNARDWVPYVRYSYEVDGQGYTGENYRFYTSTQPGQSKVGAEKKGNTYKPGKALKVRVNPDDASESVIVATARTPVSSYITLVFSGIGILVGGALARGGIKGMRAAA
ncbi:MAG: DUF3592 domain-containing protein [Phycisphaerales bacterium]|nr:DUF3592 domain-containing protein [Phycisphaerales bacterium]